jgi:predicted metalloprotease
MLFGADPSEILNMLDQTGIQQTQPTSQTRQTAPTDELSDFISVVLADTEDTWNELFRQMDRTYQEP